VPALAPGQARLGRSGVLLARLTRLEWARAFTLGLFCFSARHRRWLCAGVAAVVFADCGRPDPRFLASAADRTGGTGLYTWLLEHEPGAIVAWHVPPQRLAPLTPDSHPIETAGTRPCAEARALHAALVLAASAHTPDGRRDRDIALDCGIALFHDAGGLAIAPR